MARSIPKGDDATAAEKANQLAEHIEDRGERNSATSNPTSDHVAARIAPGWLNALTRLATIYGAEWELKDWDVETQRHVVHINF